MKDKFDNSFEIEINRLFKEYEIKKLPRENLMNCVFSCICEYALHHPRKAKEKAKYFGMDIDWSDRELPKLLSWK